MYVGRGRSGFGCWSTYTGFSTLYSSTTSTIIFVSETSAISGSKTSAIFNFRNVTPKVTFIGDTENSKVFVGKNQRKIFFTKKIFPDKTKFCPKEKTTKKILSEFLPRNSERIF